YVSQEVAEASAANTVILREGKLLGYNTDIAGVTFALRHISLTNKTVLMIGAGGAAHAAAYYLQKNNARLLWLNRTPQRALPLIEKFGGDFVTTENLNHLAIDVIINATPVGMFPEINRSPLPHYLFHAGQIVFDM